MAYTVEPQVNSEGQFVGAEVSRSSFSRHELTVDGGEGIDDPTAYAPDHPLYQHEELSKLAESWENEPPTEEVEDDPLGEDDTPTDDELELDPEVDAWLDSDEAQIIVDDELQQLGDTTPDSSEVNGLVDYAQQLIADGNYIDAEVVSASAYYHAGKMTLDEIVDSLNSSYSAKALAAAYARVKGIDFSSYIN